MAMEVTESCSSGAVDSSPMQPRQQRRKLDVYKDVLHRLKDCEDAPLPGFEDELRAHFNRLPPRYALYVNVQRAQDVLMHKRLLQMAVDPANRPAFDIHVVQVSPIHDSLDSDLQEGPDTQNSLSNVSRQRTMHEITFSADDRPKLFCQLTYLLAEIGLKVQEAHAFSTNDGYSLGVFIVDGWPYEETEQLRHAIQKEIQKIERRVESCELSSEIFQLTVRHEPTGPVVGQ